MTFKSTKVEKTGDTTAKVTGDMTIMGVTQPATLDVKLNKIGTAPNNQEDRPASPSPADQPQGLRQRRRGGRHRRYGPSASRRWAVAQP
jgi:hypothetical protein